MMTIDQEIEHVINFLKHPAGFDISMADLHIKPIYGTIDHWEVDWEYQEAGIRYDFHRIFPTLEEAAAFFVEKRRYLCLGLDFNRMAVEGMQDD